MEALKTVPAALHVLACPEDCAAEFAPLAEAAAFELVTGPKEDVLGRYCQVIRRFSPDRIIRATGDNPFVFADAAEEIAREGEDLQADYAAFSGLPLGAGVESAAAEALLRAEREAASPAEREHVCPYLYGRPELFRLHRPLAPRIWQFPSLRLTVDTPEDLLRAQVLVEALKGSIFPSQGETIIGAWHKTFAPAAEAGTWGILP
jgi:spore coat polysaccharide biosynthesis protein SpsF